MSEKQDLVIIPNKFATIQPTNEFQAVLSQISETVQKGDVLLNELRNSESEEEFIEITRKLRELQRYGKDIEEARKSVRRAFDDEKKRVDNIFKEQLELAGFDKLNEISQEVTRLNRELQHKRKRERWNTVKAYIEEQLDTGFSNVKEYLPNINADRFERDNQSFVGGGQQFSFSDKKKSEINNYFQKISNDLVAIRNIQSPFEKRILENYEQTLDLASSLTLEKELVREAERESKRREEQLKRQKEAIEKENKKNEQKAKLQNQAPPKQKDVKYLNAMYEIGKSYNKLVSRQTAPSNEDAKAVFLEIKQIIEATENV